MDHIAIRPAICVRSAFPPAMSDRVERVRGPVWYAKYRLPAGRQVQKKLGPRGPSAVGHRRATSPSAPPRRRCARSLTRADVDPDPVQEALSDAIGRVTIWAAYGWSPGANAAPHRRHSIGGSVRAAVIGLGDRFHLERWLVTVSVLVKPSQLGGWCRSERVGRKTELSAAARLAEPRLRHPRRTVLCARRRCRWPERDGDLV